MESNIFDIMSLIAKAPWREAVTYRETWPHEYVLSEKDGQQELLEAVRQRFQAGEGVSLSLLQHEQHLPVPWEAQILAE